MQQQSIVLLGAGNLAYQLAQQLAQSTRYTLLQIYNRSLEPAENLQSLLSPLQQVSITNKLEELKEADLYIYAVSDSAIASVAEHTPQGRGKTWLHTAGSVPLDTLRQYHSQAGVLYPLQTFSKTKLVDWHKTPLYIEASDTKSLQQIRSLAEELSPLVYKADSQTRGALHLSAVLACNFSNHLIALAEGLLSQNNLDSKALMPLLQEMLSKLSTTPALEAQTGPAKRGDEATMARHIELLHDSPTLQNIYRMLSQSIQASYSSK